jgi:ribonuclease D
MVALDTEFVREQTYYPELCLIQLATDEVVACVDCLAPLELEPLLRTMLEPHCSWLLHSARQDLEVVWNLTHALPARVLDTQIASALLGFPPQLGLQGLLAELLGVHLEKAYTRTDWSRRPLPAAALKYAFDDVRFLLPAWQELRARLAARERLEWFEEDCQRLVAEPPVTETTVIFQRLKGVAALSARAQCGALALVEWRERRARDVNRPRRWVLADEELLRICRTPPASSAELRAIPDLPRRLVERSGKEILAAIAQADTAARRETVEALLADRKPERTRLAAVQAAVKQCSTQLGIHAEVLATRKDIGALAAGAEPRSVLSGWRARELETVL